MTPEETRRRISAIATNAVVATMDVRAGRVLMTDHDAGTRDAIFDLLMSVQTTGQFESQDALLSGAIPMVPPTQGLPDAKLDLVLEALEAAE